MTKLKYSLSELCISQAARAWQNDGEILATGIGLLPRIAVSLSKNLYNPDLMMTDGEAFLVDKPYALGLGIEPALEGYMNYSRVFDLLWSGARHAMVTPTQLDSLGHMNISCIGDYNHPKVQLLGVRGFPGNSINHRNSMFIPNHSKKVFVDGRVDMAASLGFDSKDYSPDIGIVITNLCVFDFNGKDNALRLLSIHPGHSLEDIKENTGFKFDILSESETELPSEEELMVIRNDLDPKNLRDSIFGD
tara:strand:+ start:4712 stop:5455 length:744 start_codon:yes stop_codon:yes gene_type:complete